MSARQPYRIRADGPEINFTFDGVQYAGREGDTLASALLAGGVRTVSRSAELGRPRGIFTAGAAEPNAFVHVTGGQWGAVPMVAATRVPLTEGLAARSLSGRGRVMPGEPVRRDKAYLHCDVLVVGGGPAGLAAARAARGRVVLIDDHPELGGELLSSGLAREWLTETVEELEALEARVLTGTTAIGYYDHNYVVAASRQPATRLWHIRAKQVVLATGALERPIAFSGNDRPGVMLAGSVRTYIRRHGVLPGRRAVVFTCTDSGYAAALDLLDAGAEVEAIADPRVGPCGARADRLWRRGVPVLRGHLVIGTDADPEGELAGVLIAAGGDVRAVECDLLAVSGGWEPALQLYRQAQGAVHFDDRLHAFVPADPATPSRRCVGACRGVYGTAAAIADGYGGALPAPDFPEPVEQPSARLWRVPAWDQQPQFVDLNRDVTVADLEDAMAAGLRSPEHIKRYTTAGTGPDQGKAAITSGVLAELLGTAPQPPSVRPPVTPVPFGLLAGRDRGALYDPVRLTPTHEWHVANGAVFEDVGQWKRPWYFPRNGETMEEAVARECAAARTDVAAIDASTLGKIDVRGPDAAAFLDRVYVGRMGNLPAGRCRYGIMCGPDGMVLDDGVAARIDDDRFHVTTTTGNAQAVLDHLEEWLQTEWPELRAWCTPVTDHWATVAVAGPRSPEIVARLGVDPDMRFMDWRPAEIGGAPGRVFRISFSGEVAYEINVPSWYGLALWEAVMALGATPYGTETMHVLRAEKGFPMIGQETDGTVTPLDLGFSRLRGDFIGRAALSRPDTARADRRRLVGLLTPEELPEGTRLVGDGRPVGHVTSAYHSAALGRPFALALVAGEHETVYAPDRAVTAEVTSPVFLTESAPPVPARAPVSGAGGPGPLARRAPLPGLPASGGDVRLREVPFLPISERRGEDGETGPGWEALHLGPDWWLHVGPPGETVGAGVDVSAQWAALDLSGPRAREVLMTGCAIDLEAYGVGGCARTLLGRVPVVLHFREKDLYRVFVGSSYRSYLVRWLEDAMGAGKHV